MAIALSTRAPATVDAPPAGRRVPARALATVTRQLAVMVGAGLPALQSLRLVAEQAGDRALGAILDDVARRVEGGSTVADAVAAHGPAFPALYAGLVRAGELGGVLEAVLHRLAAHLEQTARLRRTVAAALVYPSLVLSAAVAVTAVMLVWVVPVFAGAFASLGATLPAPTRAVLALSSWLRAHGLALSVAAAATGAAVLAGSRTTRGRRLRDRWLLAIPGLGDLLAKAAVARATRTLGTLLACGVAILDALDTAARTAGNQTVEEAFSRARSALAGGRPLAAPLAESACIPALVRQMIAVGEATGTLDVMLGRAADCCDDDVQAAAGTLLAVLEPALVLFLGAVVGGLLISMYLPIFRLGAALG